MVAGTIPVRTAQGQAELGARVRRVGQRHRTVLFLVDGRRSEAEVRRMAQQAGVPDGCFDELVGLGLIAHADRDAAATDAAASRAAAVLDVELPLAGASPEAAAAAPDEAPESLLPPARTLAAASIADVSTRAPLSGESTLGAWLGSTPGAPAPADPAFAEAQQLLLRAVRQEAPLAGALTLRRLRRARSRDELVALLGEVELHIRKPRRSLAAQQTLQRVRLLLDGRLEPSLAHD